MEKLRKAAPKPGDVEQVQAYMDKLNHPLQAEIEEVRQIIKLNPKIGERIKWNAPSYHYKEDLVTFHVRPTNHVHLVFHHPQIVNIKSALLQGDYKDRRMLYFTSMTEIKTHKKELQNIILQLIQFIDNHQQKK